jgi:peptide/nickel transport system substrate-binding protein
MGAARHLDALGFRDRDSDGWREDPTGSPLRFSLKVSSSEPLHVRAAQVVARQIKAGGIMLRVEAIDPARHRALFATRQFDLMIGDMGPHGLADPDQLVQSFRSGYLWRAGLPHPELDTLLEDWRQADTARTRLEAGFALQRFHNRAPMTIVLYYPNAQWAYRPHAFDQWRAVPGQGLFHKWSLVQLRHAVPGLPRP